MFEGFKPRSRPENESRMLRPEELHAAGRDIAAAQAENLGLEEGDKEEDLKAMSDEELVAATDKNWEALTALREDKSELTALHAFEPKAEEEFAQLQANRETLPTEVQAAIRDIEHSLETAKSDGVTRSVLDIVYSYSRPDLGHSFVPDRVLLAFSPEIQKAVATYVEQSKLKESRQNILSERAARFLSERKERGIPLKQAA